MEFRQFMQKCDNNNGSKKLQIQVYGIGPGLLWKLTSSFMLPQLPL